MNGAETPVPIAESRRSPQHILPHLKEDSDFGPRTLARRDEELLRGGPSSVIRDLNGMAVT
ncbi:MAG: hypothetical protein VX741_04825 [Pseudomonadota bacterium]|nr:hypothetical protein [Pseudomonadota bacterium]